MLPPDPRISSLSPTEKAQLLTLLHRDPQEAEAFVERLTGQLTPHSDRGEL